VPGPSLRFTDIARRYGRLAVLSGVSGEVGSGEVLVVTGRNGSGKSTLLRCLAGLLAPDAGKIEYRDDDGGSPGAPPWTPPGGAAPSATSPRTSPSTRS
jgi:ABC-type multidrug transport system ATPase subunit